MNIYQLFIKNISCLLLLTPTVFIADAQTIYKEVIPAKNGVYIIMLPGSSSTKKTVKYQINNTFQLFKSDKEKEYKRIAEIEAPETYEIFEARFGKQNTDEFFKQNKFKSKAEALTAIRNMDGKKLQFYVFDLKFLQAAGVAYFDETKYSVATRYKLIAKNSDGATQTIFEKNVPALPVDTWQRPTTLSKTISDSSLFISWKTSQADQDVVFGNVYKRTNRAGNFTPAGKIFKNNDAAKNRGLFQYSDQILPSNIYEYFIVPTDFAGNEGKPSDTIRTIGLSQNKVKGIINLTATDSMGLVMLSWNDMPAAGYMTGIKILKSRSNLKDFVVLDTIPATSNSYLDKTALPGTQYYYQVQALIFPFDGWKPLVPNNVSIATKGSSDRPLRPTGLQAVNVGSNISLSWNNNTEGDMFAYYVMRGTSMANMEVVSGPVRATNYIDSAKSLNGQMQYMYTVVAANKSQKKSDPSNPAVIKPLRVAVVPAVSGLNYVVYPEGLKLMWEDIAGRYTEVVGYLLLRKKEGELNFTAVTLSPVKIPEFMDTMQVITPSKAVYAVASVDAWGNASILSNSITYTPENKTVPPPKLYVRLIASGIEVSWPQNARPVMAMTYNIYRKKIGDIKYTLAGNTAAGVFIDKAALVPAVYQYAVATKTASGESSKSTIAEIRKN